MKKLLRRVFFFFFKKDSYKFKRVNDIPKVLKKGTIYLIDDWAISFKCPCGCLEDIHLNSIPKTSPRWIYYINDKKKISIYPSIRRTVGCKSHFWIKNGKVEIIHCN